MQKQVSKKTVYEDTPALELRSAGLGDIKDILHAQFTVFPDDPANLDEKGFERAISDRAHRLLVAYLGSSFAGYVIVSNRPYRPWSSLDNLIEGSDGVCCMQHCCHFSTARFCDYLLKKTIFVLFACTKETAFCICKPEKTTMKTMMTL